jgi:hypothetical protein
MNRFLLVRVYKYSHRITFRVVGISKCPAFGAGFFGLRALFILWPPPLALTG